MDLACLDDETLFTADLGCMAGVLMLRHDNGYE